MRFILVAGLIMSGTAIWITLGSTPAFNPKMVKDTVVGNGRVFAPAAMYDQASYNFQRGYGYLFADALISSETESRNETASYDLAIQRAELAQDALEMSLSQAPGNADAWAALGWAFIRQGDEESAINALRNSWRLAPYNRALSDTRLGLVSVFLESGLASSTLVSSFNDEIMRDINVLQNHDEAILLHYVQTGPRLVKFLEQL